MACWNVAVAESDVSDHVPGFVLGAKVLYLTPYFDSDIVGADESSGANNNLEILSFDWNGDGAYRVWGGYETAMGFGISLAHMGLNQTTDFSQVEGSGQLRVDFDQSSKGVQIHVDGTLEAENTLSLNVTDLEAWQKIRYDRMKLRFGAGLRYLSFDRSYHASETGGSETLDFDHSFTGFGPSLSYEVEIPVANGFSLYNSGRGALLFGEHKASYEDEDPANSSGFNQDHAMLPTLDAEFGLQWRGKPGGFPGELTVRAGLEAQAYINGGGWDLYRDYAGIFPQHTGGFGLHGFSLSAQYKFGAADAEYTIEADTEAPQIVMPGFFLGAKALYLTPYFDSDIVGADEASGANDDLEVLSFDWNGDGAYSVWGGYETATGFGVSLAHMGLSQTTDFSEVEGSGSLEVHFDPTSDFVDLFVNGTLNAESNLNLNVTDLEAWQKIKHANTTLRYGAGIRHASLDRRFLATETEGSEFIDFHHSFEGVGPSLGYEVEVSLTKGFSLYNSGRGALLFGKHTSNYKNEFDVSGSFENHAMLPTLDAEFGLQWRSAPGSLPGELTIRAGVEAHAYINGGGWDLYDDIGGATFPQQAGSFGLHGFSLSAQYKFGADDADYTVEADTDAPRIVMPGLFAGAKALYLTPYFERDVVAADTNSGANNSLESLNFDWDGDGAYRVWGGYETAAGFGASIAHMGLNHSTDFSQVEGADTSLFVYFDPSTDDANISVDGTLNAENTLRLNVTDLEVWQKIELSRMMLRYGAGLRYASFDRAYRASETEGPEFVDFDHSFKGFGPSLSYEVEIPVANGFGLYNSGRGALLFGKHKARYEEGGGIGDNAGALDNYAMLPTLDAELGLQWRGTFDPLPGELTIRAGVEAQAYINGGGWDMYQNFAGAQFPQHSGNFGLYGFNVSAQYKFGMPKD